MWIERAIVHSRLKCSHWILCAILMVKVGGRINEKEMFQFYSLKNFPKFPSHPSHLLVTKKVCHIINCVIPRDNCIHFFKFSRVEVTLCWFLYCLFIWLWIIYISILSHDFVSIQKFIVSALSSGWLIN